MDADIKKIYDSLSMNDKKALRAAVAEGDIITVNAYKKAFSNNIESIPAAATPEGEKKRGAGRPDLGLTKLHDIERDNNNKYIRNTKSNEIIQYTPGDVVPEGDIKQFKKDYMQIINDVCSDFYNLHPDIVKKTPFMWYNSLLLEIKKKLPIISVTDPQRVGVAWECFKELIYKIGLFPTMEAFTALTGIYKQELYRQLTPAHNVIKQQIYNDCRDNMAAQVSYNPMTQVNKLFLLKSVYGYSENNTQKDLTPDQVQKNIDDLPLFDSVNNSDIE